MRSGLLVLLAVVGCNGDSPVAPDAPSPDPDAALDGPSPDAALACTTPTGAFPRRLDFASHYATDEGEFDFSMDLDPATGRLWASFSGVRTSPEGLVLVEPRLAFSDDAGATWCETGDVLVAMTAEPSPPAELAGKAAYWNHEVSRLVRDPGAPANERWKLLWIRYLIADTPAADDRQFAYSWIGLKAAASPEQLAAAPERKLFSGSGYFISPAVTAYNNARGGAPELRLDQLDASLAGCIAFSEPGALGRAGELLVSLLCATGQPATQHLALIRLDHATETWSYTSRLLGEPEAKAINAVLDGFSAPELFERGGTTFVMASPELGGIYKGCIGYQLDPATGALVDADSNGLPDPQFAVEGTTGFHGLCAFHEASTATGIILGEAHLGASPVFRLFATGVTP